MLRCSDYKMFRYLQNCACYEIFATCSDTQIFAMLSTVQIIRYVQYICAILSTVQILRYLQWTPFWAVLPIESRLTRALEGVGKAGSPILTIPENKSYVENWILLIENLFWKSPKSSRCIKRTSHFAVSSCKHLIISSNHMELIMLVQFLLTISSSN